MGMAGPEIARLYYSTHDVCRMFDLPPHHLRMWERRFPVLKPSKSKSGRRLYRPPDIKWVGWIKRMKEHGYTDEKILRILNESAKTSQILSETKKQELPIHTIRHILEDILNILDGKTDSNLTPSSDGSIQQPPTMV
jgi:DNA-binding transcriptional MerR regulator